MAAYVDNSEENANKKPLSVGFIEKTKKGVILAWFLFISKWYILSFLDSFLTSIWFFRKLLLLLQLLLLVLKEEAYKYQHRTDRCPMILLLIGGIAIKSCPPFSRKTIN